MHAVPKMKRMNEMIAELIHKLIHIIDFILAALKKPNEC